MAQLLQVFYTVFIRIIFLKHNLFDKIWPALISVLGLVIKHGLPVFCER